MAVERRHRVVSASGEIRASSPRTPVGLLLLGYDAISRFARAPGQLRPAGGWGSQSLAWLAISAGTLLSSRGVRRGP